MFIGLALMLLVEGIRNGKVARDKTIAMMIIFAFNMLFWMFFEQAGSSFTFLAENIVDRDLRRLECSRSAGSRASTRSPSSLLRPDHRLDLGRDGPAPIRRSRASSAWA